MRVRATKNADIKNDPQMNIKFSFADFKVVNQRTLTEATPRPPIRDNGFRGGFGRRVTLRLMLWGLSARRELGIIAQRPPKRSISGHEASSQESPIILAGLPTVTRSDHEERARAGGPQARTLRL